MIDKDSLEWQLWKDAYNVRAELTPAPEYEKSGDYWKEVLDKIHECHAKYSDSHLRILADNIFLGVLLQFEQESKDREKVQDMIREVADKLSLTG